MAQRIAVIHPDLGVGGAERLIVDASKALQDRDNRVDIYTAYHDKKRCFQETRDGTLNVTSVGTWIPRTIFGRFHALLAYTKMIYIAIYITIFVKAYDLILCDQVSACLPIFKLRNCLSKTSSKILFYCHFPDQLLTARKSLSKKIYRWPIDMIEAWSTGLADVILVNSNFTSKVVKQTFTNLKDRELTVLYPCVDVRSLVERKLYKRDCDNFREQYPSLINVKFLILSLNRFERKKELELAIKQMNLLRAELIVDGKPNLFDKCHLAIAGGYDERLKECVSYYEELVKLVHELDLERHVTFFKSPDDWEKLALLQICDLLFYTPKNEHFGIVPIEAMAMSKPVIASASGGPLETVQHEVSGYLFKSDEAHTYIKLLLMMDKDEIEAMGIRGLNNVEQKFSYEIFRDSLNRICFPQKYK